MSTVFRVPCGYRFKPSDEEIIKHYLIPKIEGRPPASDHIYETAKIYEIEAPPDLESTFQEGKEWYNRYAYFDHNCDDSLYFFIKLKKKWDNSKRISRTAGGGTWSGDTKGKEIYRDSSYLVKKSNLAFTVNGQRKIQTPAGLVTWNMEEYSIEKHDQDLNYAKHDQNLDYAIVKIKKKVCKNEEAIDVAVQGGHGITLVDDAVLPEQPAALDDTLQHQLLQIYGQYYPNTNFQTAMDNGAGLQPYNPGCALLPAAENNHQQYIPLPSTIVPANNGYPALPYYPDQASSSSLVLQHAVFPTYPQKLQPCFSYNIPNDNVPLSAGTGYQYPLPSVYLLPPLTDGQQGKNKLDLLSSSPEAADDYRGIGGENAAFQNIIQEDTIDPLVGSSEVEAGQAQKKARAR